jgi:hypothetical protein
MAHAAQTAHNRSVTNEIPGGGSTGVSFNWGFALSLTLIAAASLLGRPLPLALGVPAALVSLALAAALVALGEALRRGNGVARRLQIAFHALLIPYGIFIAVQTIQALQVGNSSTLASSLIALVLTLVVSPVEIWLLLRPGSRRWYGHVTPQEALQRHSGFWLLRVLAWAVLGGVLNAVLP